MNNQVITESEEEYLKDFATRNLVAYNILEKLLDAYKASKQEGWISVSDRVPKMGEAVLVADKYGVVQHHCWYLTNTEFGIIWNIADINSDTDASCEFFTKWMSLPQPPNNALDEATESKE